MGWLSIKTTKRKYKMNRVITIAVIMLISLSASSQSKKAKRTNNDCYLQIAVTTFNLSKSNKEKLNSLLTKRQEEQASVRKKIKSKEISKDEAKPRLRRINQTYFKKVADLTGKPKKEVMVFEKTAKDKCR